MWPLYTIRIGRFGRDVRPRDISERTSFTVAPFTGFDKVCVAGWGVELELMELQSSPFAFCFMSKDIGILSIG